jgi:uncharacterized delta-60 repeat protein
MKLIKLSGIAVLILFLSLLSGWTNDRPIGGGFWKKFESYLYWASVQNNPVKKKRVHQINFFSDTDCLNINKTCTWEKTFGSPLAEKAYDIALLKTGGLVVVGHARGMGIGHDIIALRIDRAGQQVWKQRFGGPKQDHGYGVVTVNSNRIVFSGYTNSKGNGKSDIWVCCTDLNGKKVWEKTYGGALDDRSRSIAATNDGAVVVAGSTQSFGDSNGDAWIIKLDLSGKVIWYQVFGGKNEDGIFQIKTLEDGSLIATGYTDLGDSDRFDLWVLKLDQKGNRIWERTFGKNAFDSGTAISSASDGGCILAGLTTENEGLKDQAWILRLTTDGKVMWEKTIGGDKNDNAWALVKLDASQYVVVMATDSFGSGSVDAWVYCFDLSGNKVWDRIYGGKLWDRPTSAALTEDGGLYIGGYTTSKGAGYEDFWILRLNSDGNI